MEFLTELASPVVMGILLGGLYALIALGLSMVFGVMKLINVAHGDLVIFGAYFAYAMMTYLNVDPILALIVGIPLMFGVGYAIQRLLLNKAFKVSMDSPLIIAFGISIILQNAYQLLFTPLSRGLTAPYALQFFEVGSLRLPLVYILDFLGAVIVMLLMTQFLKRTYLGTAIRAASQERRAALLMGINPEKVYAYTFAIAMSVAAVGGVCLGLTFPFVPQSGAGYLIIAFGVIVLGGIGNTFGTFIGGMIFGLAQTVGGHYVGVTEQLLIAYLLVMVVLTFRPQGIFGR